MVKKYSLVMDTQQVAVVTDALVMLVALIQRNQLVFTSHSEVIASALNASNTPHGYSEDIALGVLSSIGLINEAIDAEDRREEFFHD